MSRRRPTRLSADASTLTGLPRTGRNRRPTRSLRSGGTRALPGTGFLGFGIGVIAAVQTGYGFVRFVVLVPELPVVTPAVLAWVLVLGALAIVLATVQVLGEQLPLPHTVTVFAMIGAAIVLDVVAVWPLGDVGARLTASIAAGAALAAIATLRGTVELAVAIAATGAALGAVAVLTVTDPGMLAAAIATVAVAVAPSALIVVTVWRYRRWIQLEIDRVTVESAAGAPRLAVGAVASEELERLDADAEALLQRVAAGTLDLPLDPEHATIAATLATELRLHLNERGRETWLAGAIVESEFLGRIIEIDDPHTLAALLEPEQRDGLLTALWSLAAGLSRPPLAIVVRFGEPEPSIQLARGTFVPIEVSVDGVGRHRIPPTVWSAFARVGRVEDFGGRTASRITIGAHADRVHSP